MAIHEKHKDILQNIEFSIITIYRDNSDLKDSNTLRAVEALINYYRAKVMGREVPKISLSELEMNIYSNVISVLNLRDNITGKAQPQKKRFSRAFKKEQTPDEIYLACLRRIQKSIKFWSAEGGIKGYLDYINVFL